MASDEHKTYLGDGAYAEFTLQGIKLTTENGSPHPTNQIFMEPQVLEAFLRWLPQHFDKDVLILAIKGAYP